MLSLSVIGSPARVKSTMELCQERIDRFPRDLHLFFKAVHMNLVMKCLVFHL